MWRTASKPLFGRYNDDHSSPSSNSRITKSAIQPFVNPIKVVVDTMHRDTAGNLHDTNPQCRMLHAYLAVRSPVRNADSFTDVDDARITSKPLPRDTDYLPLDAQQGSPISRIAWMNKHQFEGQKCNVKPFQHPLFQYQRATMPYPITHSKSGQT